MQIDKQKVGTKIYNIRVQNGYSMEQFGKQIDDAPRGSVNSWEKGINLPNKERLELIAIMGNTTTNELLYGSLNEYVEDLIATSLGIKISNHFIDSFTDFLKSKGFTYGDDVEILRFAKVFFNANNIVTCRPSLYYTNVSKQDSLFIGYLEVAQDTVEPKFFVFADKQMNTLHVVPFMLNDSSRDNFTYPSQITESGGHDYFTSGLIPLKLQLRNLKMIYYGINTTNLKVQISKFYYDTASDTLILNDGVLEDFKIYDPFIQCVEKELLYLKYSNSDPNSNNS